jgi:enoyl-CoA hydratase
MSKNEALLYDEEKGIARIMFNRPEALNAMNRDLLQQLALLLDKAKVDEAVKAVIITGTEMPFRLERISSS